MQLGNEIVRNCAKRMVLHAEKIFLQNFSKNIKKT